MIFLSRRDAAIARIVLAVMVTVFFIQG